MQRIASLSTGTKLMLASGGLLFVDLFLTWQKTDLKFGKRFDVTKSMDGWDAVGLALGLLTIALLALVIIRQTDLELSPEVPWNLITLVLGFLVFGVALLKNLTDTGSTPLSYVGVALAALVAVGASLDRSQPEPVRDDESRRAMWKPRVRASGPPPASSDRSPSRRAQSEPEPRSAGPAKRW